ncbi:MAG TPA: HD domain-containing phosphohydrolase [Verrucomicrobiae bacterium]|jgi:putative nucleotidyltransferase with HDIG domain|nr:HD domain-containing phosphohydrolase [Verrucomicrobiae bacterium]
MADQRILVVDDETPVRDAVCTILDQAGFDCYPVTSGRDALGVLRSSENISIVLSDLIMEGMDGLTLLSRMKQDFPEIPVVMVTAVHDISVALAAIRNGAYDYLLKPFEREQLLAMVRRALETRRLRLENLAYQTKLESLVADRTHALRKALSDLERSYDITLEALGDALDLKDAETEGHSKRVTAFTIAIARQLDLPQERVRIIARGAFLHDVGKMAIPDAILRKPGRLSPEEQEIMRQHAALGYQLLRNIPFLQEAAEIVYSHQERYDGSGYPRGLKGDQIPLGARIFAIADTFDAMTSDRPYRAAQSISSGRREIERHAGKQFDPEIVKVFLSVQESLWQDLRHEIEAQNAKRHFGRFTRPSN